MAVNELQFTQDQLKKAQERLVAAGYEIDDASGNMTDKTRNAIIKYKSDNNLADDNAALAALYGGGTDNTNAATVTSPALDVGTDAYNNAIAALQEAQKTIPATLSGYSDQLAEIYNQIVNREKFSYDIDSDMLYQQYKNQYTAQGEAAMKDTMGQAAALTGGYGSSYAQGVGQQQYDAYLQKLNEVVPELYGQARAEYDAEGDEMQQLYALTSAARDAQYSKDMSAAAQLAQYGDFSGYKQLYGEDKGKLMEDTWFLQNPDLALKLGLIDQAKYQEITGTIPGQGGGSSFDYFMGDGGTAYNPYGYSNANGLSQVEVQQLQMTLGVTPDGIWGANTEAAYNKKEQSSTVPATDRSKTRTAYK